MSAAFEQIVLDWRDGVACITLNRPERLNAFTDVMQGELQAALDQIEARADLRGVVLTGAGRAFCAGQDLGQRKPLPDGQRRDLSQGLRQHYRPLVLRLRALPAPVLCLVNGVAAGAGASLVFACDVVVAAESARFVQAFARIGLMPDAGATYFWPRLAGSARAMGAALFGEPVSARQAQDWGLIWECVPDAEFEARAAALIARLAQGPTRAWAATKTALHASAANTLEAQFDLECALQRELGYTDDYLEGMQAFGDKRAPRFTGR
ncbi:2-(1,2-epoxy-1,2-dihydrophenyl)acetyl-CoA isomerase [Bordetella genomosp. 1]|uniref:2-(1,2-epoxy-1,2-dihydrophenyl)acetyl-CoA isomerase n=1 Tax=Bordetella genomosp. 1 TaxID=1395607 RepID=A0A261SQ34_9BORD|nr:2-(1,2-epoxy-1,2-dihydrophenyl)acetyl-CoA isomerase PaaG [Bordetella genomosp. 1]OZI39496.1 2-(1,2-epoxy-1,2-dihydrophenyl)acetyl-CoA isomerase [Bordetella genomosp. 1]